MAVTDIPSFLNTYSELQKSVEALSHDLRTARVQALASRVDNPTGTPTAANMRRVSKVLGGLTGVLDFDEDVIAALAVHPKYRNLVGQICAILYAHKKAWTDTGLAFDHTESTDFLAYGNGLKKEYTAKAPAPGDYHRLLRSGDWLLSLSRPLELTEAAGTVDEPMSIDDDDGVETAASPAEATRGRNRKRDRNTKKVSAEDDKAPEVEKPIGSTTRARAGKSSEVAPFDSGAHPGIARMTTGGKRPRPNNDGVREADSVGDYTAGFRRPFPDSMLLDFLDDGAVSNTFVRDIMNKVHRQVEAFKDRAQDEDTLRGVLSDLKIQMTRSIHRLSVESAIFEHLNGEYAKLKASLTRST
ncbi:hypothetical protein NMY22_g10967 [Coprinellus aureogranulatus]|nr:hypothetical protein NMY22_g10967 [Coprinellus aureogranulatus]